MTTAIACFLIAAFLGLAGWQTWKNGRANGRLGNTIQRAKNPQIFLVYLFVNVALVVGFAALGAYLLTAPA